MHLSCDSYLVASCGTLHICGLNLKDVVYIALPMYHMSGGVMAVSMEIIFGCTGVIRRRFSSTHFWSDCAKYRCTVGPYQRFC